MEIKNPDHFGCLRRYSSWQILSVSGPLAIETRHFANDSRTVNVEQQVKKDSPEVLKYLKTAAAKRQVEGRSNQLAETLVDATWSTRL
jgi:hypothetical protein